jgi:hypothetical protein
MQKQKMFQSKGELITAQKIQTSWRRLELKARSFLWWHWWWVPRRTIRCCRQLRWRKTGWNTSNKKSRRQDCPSPDNFGWVSAPNWDSKIFECSICLERSASRVETVSDTWDFPEVPESSYHALTWQFQTGSSSSSYLNSFFSNSLVNFSAHSNCSLSDSMHVTCSFGFLSKFDCTTSLSCLISNDR